MRTDSETSTSFTTAWGSNAKKISIKEVIRFTTSDLNFQSDLPLCGSLL